MNYTKHKAFTLVELIVVVTILAILATIGFVSYSSYLTGVRDTNRLAQMVSISDGLELYRTGKDLPLPDENIEIQINGDTIGYQGYAGSNTLETIDFTKGGKDPRDGEYFSYYLTDDRKYFQLMGFLEEEASVTSSLYEGGKISLFSKTQAVDYSNRIPTVYGKKLGILTDSNNTPIQEILSTSIDLALEDVSEYVAHLDEGEKLLGSESGLAILRKAPLTNFDYGDDLVGYWDMESINSTDMLADVSGNGTHLTNNNSIDIGDVIEGENISTTFDGIDQRFYLGTGASDALDVTDDFTLSAWIYPRTYKTVGYYSLKNLVLVKGNLATINYAIQITDKNTVEFIERSVGDGILESTFSGVPDLTNKWTHLVIVIENSEASLYIDGEFFSSDTVGTIDSQSDDPIYLGGTSATETLFDGYIDEVKVFNIPMNESEIERLFESR